MRFVLDTCLIINAIRQKQELPFPCFLSVISLGELEVIARQNKWGEEKLRRLKEIVDELVILDVERSMVNDYVEVELYSRGRLPGVKKEGAARVMQDNDTWIAATARYCKVPLQTCDNDFDHLDGVLLDVQKR